MSESFNISIEGLGLSHRAGEAAVVAVTSRPYD